MEEYFTTFFAWLVVIADGDAPPGIASLLRMGFYTASKPHGQTNKLLNWFDASNGGLAVRPHFHFAKEEGNNNSHKEYVTN